MKKYISLIILSIIMYKLLLNSSIVHDSIISSFNLWKNNIFPYLFPFFIISDLLINLNVIEIINKFTNKFINKIFKINSYSSFIFLMSILSGIPSNAKYIKTLQENNNITEKDSNKIILFTHFISPMFILGFIKSIVGLKYSIYILFTHYLTNIILGIIFRNYNPNLNNNFNYTNNNSNLLKVLSNSIITSINTLLLILGVISFFSFITVIITASINNDYIRCIINSILEITQGINNLKNLNISLELKTIFITSIISFGGISTHIQIMSILEDTHIKYFNYLCARILHSIISTILIIILIY